MEKTYVATRQGALGKVFFGLALSLVTAFLGVYAGQYVPLGLIRVLAFVELGMIIVAMLMQRRRRIGMPFVFAFTFISGITLYPTMAYYAGLLGPTELLKGIGISAIAFTVAAIVASRTSFDFSFLGGFLLIGLIAILGMGILSFFIGFGTGTHMVISIVGIMVFVGYVLFDVNRLAHNGITDDLVPFVVLSLYLDLINLILFVLQLMGLMGGQSRR